MKSEPRTTRSRRASSSGSSKDVSTSSTIASVDTNVKGSKKGSKTATPGGASRAATTKAKTPAKTAPKSAPKIKKEKIQGEVLTRTTRARSTSAASNASASKDSSKEKGEKGHGPLVEGSSQASSVTPPQGYADQSESDHARSHAVHDTKTDSKNNGNGNGNGNGDSKKNVANQGSSSANPIPIIHEQTTQPQTQSHPPQHSPSTSTTARTHTVSPLSSHKHNEHLTLSSGLILDHFGPTVQTVFDCLCLKGSLPFPDLHAFIKLTCSKAENADRTDLITAVQKQAPNLNLKSQASSDSEIHGYVVEPTSIKAALLVLLNHGVVSLTMLSPQTPKSYAKFTYEVNVKNASRLARYDRYVKHVRDYIGSSSSGVVRQVLCRGMMRTEDVVVEVADGRVEEIEKERKEEFEGKERKEEIRKMRKEVIDCVVKLRDMRILVEAPTTGEESNSNDHEPPTKKRKVHIEKDDGEVVDIVRKCKRIEEGCVWVVNFDLLDDRLKGEKVGRYFWERTGIEGGAEAVSAALFYCAKRAQGPDREKSFHFDAEDAVEVMSEEPGVRPQSVKVEDDDEDDDDMDVDMNTLQVTVGDIFSKMSKHEGAKDLISRSTKTGYNIKYQTVARLIRESCIQTYICDRWGENTARIFAILREEDSFLDSDHLSTVAMVPEKETRESLHILYQNRLVTFHDIPVSKQHAYNQTIYLWKTEEKRLYAAIQDTLRRAYINMRDRRRVYTTSDKAAVFDRLIAKSANNYSGEKKDGDGQEEKECKENLSILDYAMSCADDDMVMFDFDPFRNQMDELFM